MYKRQVPNSHQVKDKADEIKEEGLWQEVRDRYLAVSYTHLDVYKRQLRQTIRQALTTAASFDEFSALLLREGVTVKESRGLSLIHI